MKLVQVVEDRRNVRHDNANCSFLKLICISTDNWQEGICSPILLGSDKVTTRRRVARAQMKRVEMRREVAIER